MSDVVVVALWIGVCAYALFGGADFGAGFWDLVAGGHRRGARPRALIDAALAPVWEANHVWLIFCFVVLWTAFPPAFAAVASTLWVPLTVAALGIVLRGSGFAFVRVSTVLSSRRAFGATFALSSVLTPFCFGAVAGGIASGRVPTRGSGDSLTSWCNPTGLVGGTLAVVTCAYLAATFLTVEASRRGLDDLERYFRIRALGAAVVAGVIAGVGLFVLQDDSAHLSDGLTHRALPLIVISVLAGLAALVLLVRRAHQGARVMAALAVAAVVGGWGVAQYPRLLGTHLTIDQAAAPTTTLAWVFGVGVVATLTCVPALALLYVLSQRGRLTASEAPLGRMTP